MNVSARTFQHRVGRAIQECSQLLCLRVKLPPVTMQTGTVHFLRDSPELRYRTHARNRSDEGESDKLKHSGLCRTALQGYLEYPAAPGARAHDAMSSPLHGSIKRSGGVGKETYRKCTIRLLKFVNRLGKICAAGVFKFENSAIRRRAAEGREVNVSQRIHKRSSRRICFTRR